jgi:ATP-dependent helicase/nuclease subunit A
MRVYLASAGTGKTHALVEELKGLIQSGVPLRRIAALTFTRKAAEELRGRAKRAVLALSAEDPRLKEAEREVHGALFTTIHGFMAEALRHTAPLMGLDPDFALLDTFLAEALFLEEARSLLYRKGLDGGLAGALLHLYRKRTLAETLHPLPGAEGVFALYLEALEGYRKRLPAFLSPSDLEALALRILENREALRRVVERFPHILLDEYQDTGPLQGRFFQGLKEAGARLVAVGDPKQSIYLFRNARVEVFREALKRAEEVRYLSTTYRHAQAVAEFLNRFTALFGEEGVEVGPTGRRWAGWRCTGWWGKGGWRRRGGPRPTCFWTGLWPSGRRATPFRKWRSWCEAGVASLPWRPPSAPGACPTPWGGGGASSPGPRCGTSTTP